MRISPIEAKDTKHFVREIRKISEIRVYDCVLKVKQKTEN